MSQGHSAYDDGFLWNSSNQSSTLLTQLDSLVITMHHVDEILGWLAYVLVRRWDIPAVQFWANQRTSTQQMLFEPRASSWQDQSFPGSLLENQHVANVGKHFLESGRTTVVQHVSLLFSSHQAILYSRHGLNFCAGYTLSQPSVLPPPSRQDASSLRVPTPLAMVALHFFRQTPQEGFLHSSQEFVEQALIIAQKRGLLLPPSESFSPPAQTWTLAQLLPRRIQNVGALQASNPFANSVVISDKNARRLYAAIDGRKSLAELAQQVRLDQKTLVEALRFLLTIKCIQLYEPGGEAVDTATILQSLS